jgi:hypothetical protein
MSQKLEYELKGKSDVEQVTGRAKKSVETLGQSFKKAGDDIVKRLTAMFAGAVLFDKAIRVHQLIHRRPRQGGRPD